MRDLSGKAPTCLVCLGVMLEHFSPSTLHLSSIMEPFKHFCKVEFGGQYRPNQKNKPQTALPMHTNLFSQDARCRIACPDIPPVTDPFPVSSKQWQQMVKFPVSPRSKAGGADSSILLQSSLGPRGLRQGWSRARALLLTEIFVIPSRIFPFPPFNFGWFQGNLFLSVRGCSG